jgi:nucleoid DNA-binding protein
MFWASQGAVRGGEVCGSSGGEIARASLMTGCCGTIRRNPLFFPCRARNQNASRSGVEDAPVADFAALESKGALPNLGMGRVFGRLDSTGGSEMSAKRLTKSQVIAEIAEASKLDRQSVGRVFDGLTELITKELRKPSGEFVIPGLLKLRSIKKPATNDRPGVNPFTKEPITIKGKPAQKKVRATALKALKDLIQ